jgi:outer membrane protein insertion porin family
LKAAVRGRAPTTTPDPDAPMTRHPQRRLALALAVAAALCGPAWAQTAEAPAAAPSATTDLPFVVGDIRVDGQQRIVAGTVFTYLPV